MTLSMAILVSVVSGADTSTVTPAQLFAWGRNAVAYAGVEVLPQEALRTLDSTLRRCDEAACLSRVLADKAELALLVIYRHAAPRTLTVELIDVRRSRTLQTELVEVRDDPRRVLNALLLRMLRAEGHAIYGAVNVVVVPSDAIVQVDGAARASSRILLPAGRHRVSISHPDHEPHTTSVTVDEGADAELHFRLEPVSPIHHRWWFWTGIGAAVAAGVGLTAYFATRPRTVPICHGPDPTACE